MLLLIKNCPGEYCFDLSITLAEVLTILGAIIAFLVALCQYKKAQQWKRTEFKLTYMTHYKEILKDFNVMRGLMMLDWNSIEIPLKEEEIGRRKKFWFDDEILRSALRIHLDLEENEGFSDVETVIRFSMDETLEKLGAFYPFFQEGNIKKDEVPGTIIYWLDLIGNKENQSKDEETRKTLWKYIIKYRFTDLINLCSAFGYKIELEEESN